MHFIKPHGSLEIPKNPKNLEVGDVVLILPAGMRSVIIILYIPSGNLT